mmetsp:Transcript_22108/g.39850  ORF Transcript_22108/g.39850 Transcript_22108/m.39850 type:complete len:103 (+) Transcript_22108:856-1164(+)
MTTTNVEATSRPKMVAFETKRHYSSRRFCVVLCQRGSLGLRIPETTLAVMRLERELSDAAYVETSVHSSERQSDTGHLMLLGRDNTASNENTTNFLPRTHDA